MIQISKQLYAPLLFPASFCAEGYREERESKGSERAGARRDSLEPFGARSAPPLAGDPMSGMWDGHRQGGGMRRRLFNVFAAVSLLLFLAVVAVWVRSYWFCGHVHRGTPLVAEGNGERVTYQTLSCYRGLGM